VHALTLSNNAIASFQDRLVAALSSSTIPPERAAMSKAIAGFKPDLVHVHNFFPLLSPGVYGTCRAFEFRWVQTLHNYRAKFAQREPSPPRKGLRTLPR